MEVKGLGSDLKIWTGDFRISREDRLTILLKLGPRLQVQTAANIPVSKDRDYELRTNKLLRITNKLPNYRFSISFTLNSEVAQKLGY